MQPRHGLTVHRKGIEDAGGTFLSADWASTSKGHSAGHTAPSS